MFGQAPCSSGSCSAILRTADGGATWSSVTAPAVPFSHGEDPGGVSHIRFANPSDGWLFGPDLWSTHDGGGHWAKVALPGAVSGSAVTALETSAGAVHAISTADDHLLLDSSPVATDAWSTSFTLPAGAGPVAGGHLVLQRDVGWAFVVNRVVGDGARLAGARWSGWTPPCQQVQGPAVVAASSPTNLVAVCDEGLWGGERRGARAWFSGDGGQTFQEHPGALPPSATGAVATPAPSTVVIDASAAGADQLVATFDGGTTWSVVHQETGGTMVDLGFTTPAQGVAVHWLNGAKPGQLLMTHDGGHQWAPVSFTPAHA